MTVVVLQKASTTQVASSSCDGGETELFASGKSGSLRAQGCGFGASVAVDGDEMECESQNLGLEDPLVPEWPLSGCGPSTSRGRLSARRRQQSGRERAPNRRSRERTRLGRSQIDTEDGSAYSRLVRDGAG